MTNDEQNLILIAIKISKSAQQSTKDRQRGLKNGDYLISAKQINELRKAVAAVLDRNVKVPAFNPVDPYSYKGPTHKKNEALESIAEAEARKERDPYAEGAEAAESGASDSDNPYPVTSDDHLKWNDGWISRDN